MTNTKSTAFAGSFLNNRSPAATSLHLQSATPALLLCPYNRNLGGRVDGSPVTYCWQLISSRTDQIRPSQLPHPAAWFPAVLAGLTKAPPCPTSCVTCNAAPDLASFYILPKKDPSLFRRKPFIMCATKCTISTFYKFTLVLY